MIYELRTYTVKPGTIGDVVKAASTVSRDIRKDDFGKLEGYWLTEIGPLNQVMHLWSYSDFAERARLRAELAKNARWTGGISSADPSSANAPGCPPAQCDQAARCAGLDGKCLRVPELSRQARRCGEAVARCFHRGPPGA